MIQTYKRDARFSSIDSYCHMADKNAHMEVTEWYNGEGMDIVIESKNRSQVFSLTWGEYQLLQVLINYKEDKNESL